jgi:hypothetical protein
VALAVWWIPFRFYQFGKAKASLSDYKPRVNLSILAISPQPSPKERETSK